MSVIISTPFVSQATISNYKATVLADNPLSYWRLGESSGTVAVDEMGNFPSTYINAPTLGQTGAIANDTDTAVFFDGVNDYADTGSGNMVIPASGHFSIEAWFKPDTGNPAITIIRGNDGAVAGINGWSMVFDIQSAISARFGIVSNGGSSSATVNVAGTYVAGTYYHLVGVFSTNADIKLYVNGVLGGTTPTGIITLRATGDPVGLLFGATNNSTAGAVSPTPGTIDEIAVYTYRLNGTQVLAHYNAGIGI